MAFQPIKLVKQFFFGCPHYLERNETKKRPGLLIIGAQAVLCRYLFGFFAEGQE